MIKMNETPLFVIENTDRYANAISHFAGDADWAIYPANQGCLFSVNGRMSKYYLGVLENGECLLGSMYKGKFSWYKTDQNMLEIFGK